MNKTINTGVMHRSFDLSRDAINEEARTVELSFSSEAPVSRWFGEEILDHSPASIRLALMKFGRTSQTVSVNLSAWGIAFTAWHWNRKWTV